MKYDIESIEKRKRTGKIFKRVLYVLLIILIYNFVLVFLSSINKSQNVNILGYKSYIITSSSMEPNIKIGDVVIAKEAKENDLKEGDIITFSKNNEVITHRISKIEKKEGTSYYTTKGDNNNVEDKDKIKYSEIEGKSVMTIPKIGKFIGVMENQIIILVLILVVLILLFMKIKRDEKKDNRREKKKIESGKNDEFDEYY